MQNTSSPHSPDCCTANAFTDQAGYLRARGRHLSCSNIMLAVCWGSEKHLSIIVVYLVAASFVTLLCWSRPFLHDKQTNRGKKKYSLRIPAMSLPCFLICCYNEILDLLIYSYQYATALLRSFQKKKMKWYTGTTSQ